jgi:phospholipid transport system substrate-binding protein
VFSVSIISITAFSLSGFNSETALAQNIKAKALFTEDIRYSTISSLDHRDELNIAAASKGEAIKDLVQVGLGAQNFIDSMGKRAIDFLADEELSIDEKQQSFRRLLEDSFDMNTIGRFSLGRYWRVSTKQQQDEYLSLFREMVIEIYSQRFEEYKGQGFETRGYRSDSPKDTIVHSFIIPKETGAEIQVDWRVRYKNGRYKVVDVIVEGVSMSVTQRSDFSSVIQRGGGNIESLLAHLRSR